MIAFRDLEPRGCRFIPGEPDGLATLYCGKPRIGSSSYCQTHHTPSAIEYGSAGGSYQRQLKQNDLRPRHRHLRGFYYGETD
jgi:hypothetical protein